MLKLIFLFATGAVFSGGVTPAKKDTTPRAKPDVVKYQIYDLNEVSPEFPGGAEKFLEFVRANLKKISGASGKKVILIFMVESDGSITNITVGRGINEEANQEAIRVMKLSPKWTPGSQMGKAVRLACTAPIKFN